jgi:hypothetical protein
MIIQDPVYRERSLEVLVPLWLVCLFLAVASAESACGQAESRSAAPSTSAQSTLAVPCQYLEGNSACASSPKTVPLPHLYWHFLMYQNHLDQFADKLEKQGKDGEPFRQSIQNKVGFSDEEFVPVRESAQRLKMTLDDIYARIMAVVRQERERNSGAVYSDENPSPAIPAIKALSQERENAIAEEISRLNDQLGPENAERLKRFITEHFAANVAVKSLSPPATEDPQSRSSSEVQP